MECSNVGHPVFEVLDGKRLDMPPVRQTSVTYKLAAKALRKAAEQAPLYGEDEPA